MAERGFLLVLLTCAAWCGCRPVNVDNAKDHLQSYYDIRAIVQAQADMLDSLRPTLQKRATINGITERAALVPDSAAWAEELDPLLRLDLNEPHLADLYDTSEGEKAVRYISRKPGETRVDEMEITLDSAGRPVRITAEISNKNPLFSMARSVQFDFVQEDLANLLNTYTIRGWQKMILLDTNRIEAFAEVRYGWQ